MITDLISLGSALIKRIFPDKEKQKEAEIRLYQMQQAGELKLLEEQMKVMVYEAKSKDKWTSRARPSFMYVIYIMILASLPMGVLYAFNPTVAKDIAVGMKDWLAAIPNALWTLFGVGYTGYVAGRSFDKGKILSMKDKI